MEQAEIIDTFWTYQGAIMFFLLLGLFAHVDLHLRLHLRLCVLRGYSVKILPYTQDFQVSSCLWLVLSLLRHVQKCAKQALENILRDMHLIKAIRSVEDLPLRQISKNKVYRRTRWL